MVNIAIKKILETYNIEKQIGKGGMGDVYLATDKRLDRPVAIKVLKPFLDDTQELKDEYVTRFLREAKAIAKLNHPNIVGLYDIGEEGHNYYMIMEYVEGKNLSDVIQKQKSNLPYDLVLRIATQLTSALSYAHQNKIVHRDIKPANVLITGNGNVKLTDFGIAQLNNNEKNLTQAGFLLGSFVYMPPEQMTNASQVDSRADIYSLGVTLYEILTGKLPFDGDNVAEILNKVLTQKHLPPSKVVSGIPEGLDIIIGKALEKDPNNRYQNADEMFKSLVQYQNLMGLEVNPLTTTNTHIRISDTIPDGTKFTSTIPGLKTTVNKNILKLKTTTLKLNKKVLSNITKQLSWVEIILADFEFIKSQTSFETLNKKISEPDMKGNKFSGIVSVDEHNFIFVYDGKWVGAIDTQENLVGEQVFELINKNSNNISFVQFEENDKYIPVVISNMISISGESIQENLNTSLAHLLPVIEGLSSEETKLTGYVVAKDLTKEDNESIYVYGYSHGKKIFSIKYENDNVLESGITLQDLVLNENIGISIYKAKLPLLQNVIKDNLRNSYFEVTYKTDVDGSLDDILVLGKEELTHCFSEAVKDNLEFNIVMKEGSQKTTFLDEEINYEELIRNSKYYDIAKWLVTEFMFTINMSKNIDYFKSIYNSIPKINKVTFFEEFIGEHGCNHEFTITAKDESDNSILLFVREGNGSKFELETFIHDVTSAKKKLQKDKLKYNVSAFYISDKDYANETLNYYYKNTKSGTSLLGKSKAFVKTGFTDGYNLLLLKYSDKQLNISAPNLYDY